MIEKMPEHVLGVRFPYFEPLCEYVTKHVIGFPNTVMDNHTQYYIKQLTHKYELMS